MVFVGYEGGSKAYRFFNPATNKVVISQDVVFKEDEQWTSDDDRHDQELSSDGTFTINQLKIDNETPQTEQPAQANSTPETGNNSHNEFILFKDETQHIPDNENNTQEQDMDEVSNPEVGGKFRSLREIYENTLAEVREDEMCLLSFDEPMTFDEAIGDKNWREAMNEEMNSIIKNKTWELAELPRNHKAIGLKWIFKLKKDSDGAIVKHKARIVAKGYVQRHGIDFEEVFAPVARLETVRLLLAMAAQEGWKVHHLDVKSAFLNGELEEEVYVMQPLGYEEKGKEAKVLRLKKALYGLRQAPRAWNAKLDKSLREIGFKRCSFEHVVYKKQKRKEMLVVGVYVDDLIVLGSNPNDVDEFKNNMEKLFEMSNLGLLSYYLGIEVNQQAEGITLSQSSYAMKILNKLGMGECRPCKVPMDSRLKMSKVDTSPMVDATMFRSAIGSLRYLLNTRPDLAFSVGVASRFMESPTTNHLALVKQILRYVKGTLNYGLKYTRKQKEKLRLIGYSDSDLGGDIDDRKSTTGVLYMLGDSPITWLSQKQRVVALSSCEAEYIAATAGACQGIWLQRLLGELRENEAKKVMLKIDNKSAFELAKNPVHHDRSKHIDVRYHFVRDCVQRGDIDTEFVKTEEQLADILIKPLPRNTLEDLCQKIEVKNVKEEQD